MPFTANLVQTQFWTCVHYKTNSDLLLGSKIDEKRGFSEIHRAYEVRIAFRHLYALSVVLCAPENLTYSLFPLFIAQEPLKIRCFWLIFHNRAKTTSFERLLSSDKAQVRCIWGFRGRILSCFARTSVENRFWQRELELALKYLVFHRFCCQGRDPSSLYSVYMP